MSGTRAIAKKSKTSLMRRFACILFVASRNIYRVTRSPAATHRTTVNQKIDIFVVPKKEIDYIFDMDDTWYRDFFSFARKVAAAIEKVIACKRIGIAVVGLEVPHAHIHLIPLNDIYDIDFKKPKLSFTPQEFADIANQISNQLSAI